ncbi:hypothetical protein QKY00_000967 [Salmonella enterica]|nr:hypothetical protein [Salmonella enterica]EHY68997.1 hypothetical protein SEHO0A_00021 [Salmonella enterica subsp. houtenae str. ATCC BAA-1581]ENZ88248.1 hypothetical protein D088_970064 [Salmonella enterica subsp. houtenae serovar 16:z4,z32:-- str. RKS3027]MBA3150425.1 hypothetical protein [Salmonella bongori]HCM1863763.1 hypothetical protein [Salmonella enterica subsp. houtenae serovar 43:z4,z32:-]HCM2006725.1 hypothetical protein [Salmonella enterica subsp. houtenae serovar 18:z36,z38:-]
MTLQVKGWPDYLAHGSDPVLVVEVEVNGNGGWLADKRVEYYAFPHYFR